MKKIKGFTLVELLAVIALIGVLAVIAVPSVNKQIEKVREKTMESYASSLEDAAKRFITKCIAENHCTDNAETKSVSNYLKYKQGEELIADGNAITYQTLKVNEYIDKLVDPKTGEECDGHIYVTKNLDKGTYNYDVTLYCASYIFTTENAVQTSTPEEKTEYSEKQIEYIYNKPSISYTIDGNSLKEWYLTKPIQIVFTIANADKEKNQIQINGVNINCNQNALKNFVCRYDITEEVTKDYRYEYDDINDTIHIKIDKTMSIISQPIYDDSVNSLTKIVKLEFSDLDSGIKQYTITDPSGMQVRKICTENCSNVSYDYTATKRGTYTILVNDVAGNNKSTTFNINSIKTKNPTMYISADLTSMTTLKINIKIKDDLDVDNTFVNQQYNYYYAKSDNELNISNSSQYTLNTVNSISGLDGSYYIYVKQINNKLGKATTSDISYTKNGIVYHKFGPYNMTQEKPKINMSVTNANTYTKLKDYTFSVITNKSAPASDTLYYNFTKSSTIPNSNNNLSIKMNSSVFNIGSDFTGEYYLYVKQFKNTIGNNSISDNGNLVSGYHRFGPYKYDNTPPTCEILPSTTSITNSVTLTVTNGKDVTGETNQSGLANQPYSWSSKTVTENGTYSATVTDKVGNQGSCSINVTNIDKTPPYTPYISDITFNNKYIVCGCNSTSSNITGLKECTIEFYKGLSTISLNSFSILAADVESQSPIVSYAYRTDTTDWITSNQSVTDIESSINSIMNNIGLTAEYLYIKAKDLYGNSSDSNTLRIKFTKKLLSSSVAKSC